MSGGFAASGARCGIESSFSQGRNSAFLIADAGGYAGENVEPPESARLFRSAVIDRHYSSIRGNNGTGLPTTCPSGNFPHSASASENRSSFPLNSVFQFS
jgi:hypothetical protein